mmetsp:Transcript_54353/g.110935  ORF Transcript_54353/g.110935 Transcript_54353/m.110935 type:complete len:228 (+) Transcript_54353:259-942(+)
MWDELKDGMMLKHLHPDIYQLPPLEFQNHCYDTCVHLVELAIMLSGRTSAHTHRPPYRTKEMTKWLSEARVLEAAKREGFSLLKQGGEYHLGTKRALIMMGYESWITTGIPNLQQWVVTVRTRLKEVLEDIERESKRLERENISKAVEQARKNLGEKRFSVQQALHKKGAQGTLDAVIQRVPVGLIFSIPKAELERQWRDCGADISIVTFVSHASGSAVRANSVDKC